MARRGRSTAAAASAASNADLPAWTRPSWDVRVLFDGDCPLCVREVDFLRARDDGRGRLDLVDIASDDYDPRANRGVDFETAMATIHGITPEGDIITGIEVFERAYAAVGLGWVYAFAKYPALLRVANRVYDFWAERRLAVTGRPGMEEVMEARRARDAAGERPRVPYETPRAETTRSDTPDRLDGFRRMTRSEPNAKKRRRTLAARRYF